MSPSSVKNRALFFLLSVTLFLFHSARSFAEETRVRAAYSALSGSMAWLWSAHEAGYFERHGLNVDLVYIGGTAQLFQALLSREVLFGIGGGPSIINANVHRQSIVGVGGTLNRMIMKIMAAPQIKTPADVRNKRIAVTRYGSITDFSARLFLKKMGLSAEKDATIIQVGGIPNVLASLQSGATQIGVLSPPAHLQAEMLGFPELMDLSKEDIYYPYTYIAVTAESLQRKRELIRPFLAASVEGIHRFKTDKPFAKKLIAKYLRVQDGVLLEQTHRIFSDLFEKVPYIKREGLTSLAQLLAEKDTKTEALEIDSIIDNRFVRELEVSGFIDALYK